LCLVAVGLLTPNARPANKTTLENLKRDITFLASDQCEGRGPGTSGIQIAGEYVAKQFSEAGLKPGGVDGTYFQPFTVPGAVLGKTNQLRLHGPKGQDMPLEIGKQFEVLGISASGKRTAPLVFAGYGITAPNDAKYDDYANHDVAGKIVIILRDTPHADKPPTPFEGQRKRQLGSVNSKIQNAASHKAGAVILVNDREAATPDDQLMKFSYLASGWNSAASLPVVQMRRADVDAILKASAGKSLDEIENQINKDLKPQTTPLTGWTADIEVNVARQGVPVRNIIAVAEGSGKLANEIVVVGAHYDHLGYGGFGSLAGVAKRLNIHHGADDNGSGTTSVLELARRFGQMQHREGRRIVFMTFSGEELGLLGSQYYCRHPLFPLKDTVAMVNLDMVGRLRPDKDTKKDKLLAESIESGKEFPALVESVNKKYDFTLKYRPGNIFGASDHASFYQKQVPTIFFWTDYHPDYHRPTDTSDKINIAGMAKIIDMTEEIIQHLATTPERPHYQKVQAVKQQHGQGDVKSEGPRLRFMPSYSDTAEGVLMDDVISGGPADKAGFKAGDRILDVAGRPVKNVTDFMTIMRSHKAGEAIEFGVQRTGKKIKITAKPE
jgi:hypothetical protein